MAATNTQEVTLRSSYDDAIKTYESSILNSSVPSTDSGHQSSVSDLIRSFRGMLDRFQRSGAYNSNDEIDDLSIPTLTYLRITYFLGDLYQRLTPEHSGIGKPGESNDVARTKILAVSEHFFKEFMSEMVNLGLITEREVEIQTNYQSNSRTSRVERSRLQSALKKQIHDIESHLAYETLKLKRLRALAAEDGEDDHNVESASEEKLRDRAMLKLKWSVADAASQMQLASRELDMLGRLSDDQKKSIAAQYQAGIEEFKQGMNDKGRNTYTVLPGGMILPGYMPSTTLATNMTTTTTREQVRSELFMERNRPTMTLEEFAEGEMAEVQRQMDAQESMNAYRKAEDERLGADGIEERERVKTSQFENWRDENPPIGITTKGNYS